MIDKLYIARYNFDEEGNIIEFKTLKKDETFEQYLRRRYVEEMGGTFEGSERGNEATMKLYNSWLDKLGNPTNVYEANSREANENKLLDTYLAVLTDKKNVDETRLPLDKVTGIIKNEILPIVDGNGKLSEIVPFKELSPTYQMNKKYEYSGGKTGIGPFALNNKNHVLTQLTHLRFASNSLLQALGFNGLDGIKSKNEKIQKRDENGKIAIDEQGRTEFIIEQGLRILDWISAMINAHVDVAKDPYVIRLNIRQYTYNICNFLLRSGFGKSTFYFLPQQILKDMANAYDRASGIYGVDSSRSKTSIVKEEITKIRKQYYAAFVNAAKKTNQDHSMITISDSGEMILKSIDTNGRIKILTISDLAKTITDRDFLIEQLQLGQKDNLTDVEAYEYNMYQLLLSELFLLLNDLAQDMSKLVQLSLVDTKRFGGNFIEQDRFLYRLKSLILNSVLFDKDSILKYLDDTFLMTKINNGIIGPADMFSDIMIRGKQDFKNAVSRVLTMINRVDTNDEALNKSISNELEGLLRWQFISSKGIDIYDMFYGANTMAKRLAKIKADILSGKYPEMLTQDGKIGNQLLNYLGTLTKMSTDNYIAPDIITKNRISDDDKYLKLNLMAYWEELLESQHPEIKQFAEDLIYYQLATTAGNFTKNGIFNLLPISAIQSIGYADYMKTVTDQFESSKIDYDNFFLNNWTNDKIVKPIKLYRKVFSRDTLQFENQLKFPVLFSESKLVNGKRIPIMMLPDANPVGRNTNKQAVYRPYIKVRLAYDNDPANTILYKYIGNVIDNNAIERPVYVVVSKKGLNQEGRVVKEYDEYSNSMFDFNNIENAYRGKAEIHINEIKTLITLGSKTLYTKWLNLINRIEIVGDYLPNTVALMTDLNSIKEVEPVRTKPSDSPTSISSESIPVNDVPVTQNGKANEFTFRNDKVVQLPFALNQLQQHALRVLEDFVNDPKKYGGSITLSGYAGTGKTSIIGIFNKYLASIGIEPVFSAPTHRANAVTKMNNPGANVITLHSAFGLSPIVDLDSGYDLRKLKSEKIRKANLKEGNLLIIDESSMVSKSLYEFIEDFKKTIGINVIYVGDLAQLSPVSDDSISPVFLNKTTTVELTKVERTGDNPILEEATNLRNGKDLSFTTKLVNGKGVEYMQDGDQPNQIIRDIVASPEYQSNPFEFRILSATNAMIPNVNNMIRKQLFGDNAKLLEVGDLLMGYDNLIKSSKGGRTELISNSIDYKVTRVSERTHKKVKLIDDTVIDVEGYVVELTNSMTGKPIEDTIFILDNNTSLDSLKAISSALEWINKNISIAFGKRDFSSIGQLQKIQTYLKLNTILMKDYEENGRLKIRKTLDYGYAHTIHKSQGGTYNKVMIYYDTITGARFDEATLQQLKYVAVSRALNNVYIVTANKLNTPIIENNNQNEVTQLPNQTVTTKKGKITKATSKYTRQTAIDNPRTLYIFTDNTDRTSGGKTIPNGYYKDTYGAGGYGSENNPTTAVIRGLNNAAPISTMKYFYRIHPNMSLAQARWTDADFEQFKKNIDFEIIYIKTLWETGNFDNIVIPGGDGFFNSRIANISLERTPKLYNYLRTELLKLKDYIEGTTTTESKLNVNTISNETEAFGVELTNGSKDLWNKVFEWQKDNPNGIVAYRIAGDRSKTFSAGTVASGWIGNPFSTGTRDSDTVQKFYDWLVTGNNFGDPKRANEPFRQAIIKKILDSPEETKILYYTELNRPSHATVIGYLIRNKYLLNGQPTTQSININNTVTTNNDSANFNDNAQSEAIISSDKTILTNEELRLLRPYTGSGNPRIAVASEHTDPVFFSKRIIDILDGKVAVEDKFRPITYTGKDFAALYLITKHDGLPLKKLLEYKIPKIIHFSITGLGGTKWEPGVMKYNDLLDRIEDFIKQGLDPKMVTVRIDPIVPGVTLVKDIENIIRRASEMGIKNIRFSIMDQYSTTKKFMEELGYDYSKYYDQGSKHARRNVIEAVEKKMLSFKDKYGVNLSTCAEVFNIEGISNEACLSVSAVNNMLGTSIPDSATGKQRKECSCYGGKTDLLRYDNKCASSCVYCYAHHNANANAVYYNEDGTLKDTPLTRTRETQINNNVTTTNSNNTSGYVLHSGGANGSDSVWGEIGEQYGVVPNHYYTGKRSAWNAPHGNVEISKEDYEEGRYKVAEAARANYGYQYKTMKDNRLIRNWPQVKYADAIFAIGHLVNKGAKLFPNLKNDVRVALQVAVTGGTGYAVEMAIQAGKPVYVFDQNRKQWYKNINGKWSKSDTPTLTKNFAGIGTREINDAGRKAIEDVYNKTFDKSTNSENKAISKIAELGKQRKNECNG